MNQRDPDSMANGRRGVPKLGGSSAGFIILIVALCLIILAALIAIYFLLREERTSDEELARRRKSSHKTKYGIPAEDTRLREKLWLPSKYRRFFFSRKNRAREGFAIQSVDDLPAQAMQHSEMNQMTSPNKRDSALTMSTFHGSPTRSLASPISPSGVRFDDTVRIILPPERDRFAPSPIAPPSHIHTHLSTPPVSAPSSPTMPPHRIGHRISSNISITPPSTQLPQERDTTVHTMANSGPTTFEGGSRFLETF